MRFPPFNPFQSFPVFYPWNRMPPGLVPRPDFLYYIILFFSEPEVSGLGVTPFTSHRLRDRKEYHIHPAPPHYVRRIKENIIIMPATTGSDRDSRPRDSEKHGIERLSLSTVSSRSPRFAASRLPSHGLLLGSHFTTAAQPSLPPPTNHNPASLPTTYKPSP